MTVSSFPFEGQDTDENQYTRIARNFSETRAIVDYGGAGLKVSASATGMKVTVAAGTAMIRGHCMYLDQDEVVPIPDADTYNRIDRIVARLDPAVNSVIPTYVKGDASGTAPALTQTDVGIYELLLAEVSVKANVLGLISTDVTDRRAFFQPAPLVYTTASRPATGRPGQQGYNIQTGIAEIANAAGAWTPIYSPPADTGWVNVPVGASWVSVGAQMRKQYGSVAFQGLIQTKSGNFAANDVIPLISIGGLAASWRPPYKRNVVLAGTDISRSARGILNTDGSLVIATGDVTGAYVDLAGLSGYMP